MVIKIISELVDNIPSLEKCTDHIKRNIKEFGFDEFHRKITDHTRKAVKEGYLVEGAMLDEDLADE